ncbi:deoxyribodipyrimidine photo-lyase [Hydrogenobaculum acidophilum]
MFNHRIKALNDKDVNVSGKYVLYVMEASQREDYNHALEYAIYLANYYHKPLLVAFFITDKYKHSNLRYYAFMIEGIISLKDKLRERGINFVFQKDTYKDGTIRLSKDGVCVVLDKHYLKTQRRWRQEISNKVNIKVFEVESDVVFPIEYVSSSQVPYAYLYRNKVEKLWNEFLKPVDKIELKDKTSICLDSLGFSKEEILNNLNIDKSVSPSSIFKGGEDEAFKRLDDFIKNKLFKYKEFRSDPSKDYQSNLSPYLHFGQISPIRIILDILKAYDKEEENVKSFLNEMVVWRELSRNFCYYNPYYNQFEGIPDWAKKTLQEHKEDEREFVYSLDEFENAKTHDIYWNAAQKELLKTGKMHNYMRMYWSKKILEWSKSPKEAFDIACYLNDKYELDGRDPNGYGGISWCFGTFDRPWQERPIFGKIRYMNDKGLERKFDINAYVKKWLS